MDKLKMKNPIVEMDGDEMTRVIWKMIKDELIEPFVELNTEYYDLGLENREKSDDAVTKEASAALRRVGVGVKCATITPNAKRMEEYHLSRMYPSPNGQIRSAVDGTTFRAPILLPGTTPLVPGWKKPITIARHSNADVYKDVELRIENPSEAHLTAGGQDKMLYAFDGPGVALAMYNTDKSIYSFARSCFQCALDKGQDLWFSCKDTISSVYDGRFRDIFREVFDTEFKEAFEAAGIQYVYTLIDDAVARCMRSEGGFVWALKNYDGDVMSDMIDQRADLPVRLLRIRGRPRYGHPALVPPAEGREDLHEPHGHHLRLVRRTQKARGARRRRGAFLLRRKDRECFPRRDCGRSRHGRYGGAHRSVGIGRY